MKKDTSSQLLFSLLAIAAVALSGCTGGGPTSVTAADVDTSGAAKNALTKYDGNSDGYIDKDELKTASSFVGVMEELDMDADGRVSESELADCLTKWKESGTNITSANAVVFKGGPVAGATVTLTPEEFLGGALTPATCTTNDQGRGVLTCDKAKGMGLDGVSPGFYTVKVTTKDGKELNLKSDGAAISPFARSNDLNIQAK